MSGSEVSLSVRKKGNKRVLGDYMRSSPPALGREDKSPASPVLVKIPLNLNFPPNG